MSHLPIEDTEVFQCFLSVAQEGWELVQTWERFAKSTIGRQLVRSLDSIGANLVEGDGRYGEAEGIHFFVIARGSARESKYWLHVAERRRLVSINRADELISRLEVGMRMLNGLINYRRAHKSSQQVREETAEYGTDSGVSPPPCEYTNSSLPNA